MDIELADGTVLDAPDDADPSVVAKSYMRKNGTLPAAPGPTLPDAGQRISAPSPNTVPEAPSLAGALAPPAPSPQIPPGAGGILGGLMQAQQQKGNFKAPEYHTGVVDSLIQSLTERPKLPSGRDTWEYTKGQLATIPGGYDVLAADTAVKDFEQRYNRTPLELEDEKWNHTQLAPNTTANIAAARQDPQYQALVDHAVSAVQSNKELYGDLGELEKQNPDFWGRVIMKIPGSIGLAAPSVATLATTRNIPLAAAMAFPQAKLPTYGALRAEDVSPESASFHSNIAGAISSVSSAVPMGQAMKYGTPVFNRIVNTIATAVPTASVASIADEVNNYAATLPHDMTVADWQQAVTNGIVKLPETWALASTQAALMGAAGHFTQKYEPGASFSPEIETLMRAGADAGIRKTQDAARASAAPETNVPTTQAAPAKIAAPPVSGSPPPEGTSPRASAPVSEGNQGAASPPLQTAPAAEQTTAPASVTPAPVESAAPPASPAPSVPEPAPVPQTQPGSTTVQEPPAGGAVVPPSQPVAETPATPPAEALPVFSSKDPNASGAQFGAIVGRLSEGNRRTLLVDPDGSHFWGDRKQGVKLGTGEPTVDGEHAGYQPAMFKTAKEAKAAGAATPQTKRAPSGPPAAISPTEHMAAPNETPGSAAAPEGVKLREETAPGMDVQEGELSDEDFKRLFKQNLPAEGNRPGVAAGGEVHGRTLAGRPPNDRWAEETSVRVKATPERESHPRVVFRGSSEGVAPEHFEQKALGHATEHPSAGLGVFYTTSKTDAARYGAVVDEAHLDIRNPKVFPAGGLPEFDSKEQAFHYRQKLIAQGYDGIIVKNSQVGGHDYLVAFEPHQHVHVAPAPKPEAAPKKASAPEKPAASRPEPQDEEAAPKVGTDETDPLRRIAARKAAEGRAALAREAARTPPVAPKRDTKLGRSSFDSMWRDLAPQAQAGETPEQHAKRVEAWTERMRNAPVEQQIKIARARTERVFGFKSITIDPKLSKREALDVLLDAYNNLSTNSAFTGLPAEAMGFNGDMSLKLQHSIGGAGTRGMFSMKFGRPFGETATIQIARRADSFVHEWMHGLDFNLLTRYFLSRTGGLSEKTRLGTDNLGQDEKQLAEQKIEALPEPIRDAFLNLMRSIYLTDDASVEKIGRLSVELETSKEQLEKAKDKLKYLQDLSNKEGQREQRAIELEQQAAKTKDKFRATGLRNSAAAIRARNAKLEGDIKAAKAAVETLLAKVQDTVKGIQEHFNKNVSALFQGSLYVDKLSGDPYYSLPTELMARAGESWMGNRIGQQGGAEFLSGSPSYYNENSSRLMQIVYPNAVDRARINQALEDLFSTLATEQYFTGETHSARIPGDTRIDKELWEADQNEPTVGIVRRGLEGTIEDLRALGRVFETMRNPAKAKEALKVAGNNAMTVLNAAAELPRVYYSGRGRIFSLRGKYKKNAPLAAAIKRVGALVTTDPGSGDVQGVTLEREIAQKAQAGINRVARIAEVHKLDMDDPAQMARLHEELVRPSDKVRLELKQSLDDVRAQLKHVEGDRNKEVKVARAKQQIKQIEAYLAKFEKPRAAPENIRKAADAMRVMYDQIYYDADSVGIKLGYVSNYQRRTLNRDAVEANPKKFLEQAQAVYEFEQLRELRRLQTELDKVEAETTKWRAVERRTGNELPRTKVLQNRANKLRVEAAEVLALDPEHQAEEYLYAARTGEMFRFDAATPPSKFVKERKFGPIADVLLSDFHEKNPIESLYNYVGNSTRRIAYARRFGDDHQKRRVMMNDLRSLGMEEKDVDELNQTINALAGYHSAQVSHNQRIALDLLYNSASMALLPLNLFSQLAEPMTAGLRTGDVRDSFINLGYTIQAVLGTGDSKDLQLIADALGLISRSGHDMIAMSRLDGADMSKASKRWMSMYQRRTGVHGYTNASRMASMKLGGMFIKSVADQFLSSAGDPKKMESAVGMLKELGIEPADHERFAKYAQARGNLISLDELMAPENHDLKQQYIHALHGFVDGVIGNPKPSDKALMASHPVWRFITALTAFNMYFQRHQLFRHAKMIGREAKKIGSAETASEKAGAAKDTAGAAMKFILPMLALMVGSFAQRLIRDAYADRERAKKRLENLVSTRTVTDAADLAGATGNASQFYNYLFPNKYQQKGLLQTLGGSHFSFYADAVDDMRAGVQDKKDPNDTSNAAERDAARALYRLSVNTLAPPLLTGLGLNGTLGFLAQSQSMARSTQEGFANWVAPPTVSEKYNAMQKKQKAQEDALMTPAERAFMEENQAEDRADREQKMQDELESEGVTP